MSRLTFLSTCLLSFFFCQAGTRCVLAQVSAQASEPAREQASSVTAPSESFNRTDPFELKMELLQRAWQARDYDLARSLTHSLRDSIIQTQQETDDRTASHEPRFEGTLSTSELPPAWQESIRPWKRACVIQLSETAGITRRSEPVEVQIAFDTNHCDSIYRELRLMKILADGTLREVPSQVYREVRRHATRQAQLLWLADLDAHATDYYLALAGNPDAEWTLYPSDLTTRGEGVGLDIENAHFKASLSRQTGQLERLTLRRDHGLELFSGGEGHGEPPGIDWAHDYVDEGGFQKLRISLWDQCPDYEVIRGPLCTIVRRWGFPYSPLHPVYTPSRLHVMVEYRFYSGLPWFHKLGTMKAIQDFRAEALRDDEWVFSGQSFTEKVWMGQDGRLRFGDVDPDQQANLWGVGFVNETSRDSFVALFLEHEAEGIPELKHQGEPIMFYGWHGHVWSRYPLPVKDLPRGAVLRQKNAYVSLPFTKSDGPARIEGLRRQLMHPIAVRTGTLPLGMPSRAMAFPLARPGENSDSPIAKPLIWAALRDCKDAQLYTADINVVDLGLIYDVRVRGDVVTVVMAMPHRGRPLAGYFTHGSIEVHPQYSRPIRQRLMDVPGVRQVVVEQTWYPPWNSDRISDSGRRQLGLAP